MAWRDDTMYSIDELEEEHPGERRPVAKSKGGRVVSDDILDSWMNGLRTSFGKRKKPPRFEKKAGMTPSLSLLSVKYNTSSLSRNPGPSYGIPTKNKSMFGGNIGDSVDELTGVSKFVLWSVEAIVVTGEGLKTDAIYRASGNQSRVQFISKQQEEDMRETLDEEENVNILTNALKLYFRQLKHPLIDYRDFRTAWQTDSPVEELLMLVNGLPAAQRNTLAFLMHHIKEILKEHEHNNMGLAALGVVFGPTLMRLSPNCQDMAGEMKQQNIIIEFLIKECDAIFSDPRDQDESDSELYKGATEEMNRVPTDSEASASESDDEGDPGVTDYRQPGSNTSQHDSSSDEGGFDGSTLEASRRPAVTHRPEVIAANSDSDEESVELNNVIPESPPPLPVKFNVKPSNRAPNPPLNPPPNPPPNPPSNPPPNPPSNPPPNLPPNPPPTLPPKAPSNPPPNLPLNPPPPPTNPPKNIYIKNTYPYKPLAENNAENGSKLGGENSTRYQRNSQDAAQQPSRPSSIQKDSYSSVFVSRSPYRGPANSSTSPLSPNSPNSSISGSSQVSNADKRASYFKIDTYEKHQAEQLSGGNALMTTKNESDEELESPIRHSFMKQRSTESPSYRSTPLPSSQLRYQSAASQQKDPAQDRAAAVTQRTAADAYYKQTSSSDEDDLDDESNSDQEYETPRKNATTAV